MNENIKLQMNPSVKKQRLIRTSVALFSQDVDNYSFDITFADLELQAGDQVEVLAKLPGGEVEHKNLANLVEVDGEFIARYVFDTKLIARKGPVFCYVYLKRGDKSADVGAFYFESDLSELDKVGGKIAEVYDGRYEDLVAEFEIKLQEHHGIVEANESVRMDAETDRVSSEKTRISNENARKSAESVRVANEEVRERAEGERQAQFEANELERERQTSLLNDATGTRLKYWAGSQAEYDAIGTYDLETVYDIW